MDNEAYAAYVEYFGEDYATPENFEDRYEGEWASEKEFATRLFDDIYELPEKIRGYVDYNKFTRDLFVTDYGSMDSPMGVYVFSER